MANACGEESKSLLNMHAIDPLHWWLLLVPKFYIASYVHAWLLHAKFKVFEYGNQLTPVV
jgi:hypothetical protein